MGKSLQKRGFILIELIVVISIISILSGIIVIGVNRYMDAAKMARAKAEAKEIGKALEAFKGAYGNYPYSAPGTNVGNRCPGVGCQMVFSRTRNIPNGPYLTINGNNYYFSEFYKSDWVGYNANYFTKNGFYYVYLRDTDNDGVINCGFVNINKNNYPYGNPTFGSVYFLCNNCSQCNSYPLRTTPY